MTYGNFPVKLAYFDPKTGWTHIGDMKYSAGILTFVPTATPISLLANTNYFVIPYTCGGPSPSPTPTGVISCKASGTGAIGVLCVGSKTYAFVGKNGVEQINISGGAVTGSSGAPTHTYSDTFRPTNCSSDEKNLRVFCSGFGSSKVTDITASSMTNTEFDTHATGSLSFTGGTCTICAIAFDPMDTAFIIMDADATVGGHAGMFQRVLEGTHVIDKTIKTPDANENPGYDYVKNWIWNPQYHSGHLEIADFTNGKLFTTTGTITGMTTPDSGSVDVATHVANTGNEFTPPDTVTLADLGTATESGTTLTVSTGQSTLVHTGDETLDIDAAATDSVIHVVFYAGEFGTNRLGFGLMPTTSSGTAISDWAFGTFPNTPDGAGWSSAFDPHPIAAYNDPVNCPDCALSINGGCNWLAVIDLKKLIAAPRKSGDTHTIDPTYNLLTNHVIAYYKI